MVAPLDKNDIALVMLSGHGQQLNDDPNRDRLSGKSQSYYCPVDAIMNRPETQFSLSHLVDEILAPNVGRKMLIVDACRDVPVDRSRGRGIEGRTVTLPEDTAIFFSCRAGQQSFEQPKLGHGLFTYCLLEGLRGEAVDEGELSWSGLVAHVNKRMSRPDLREYMPGRIKQVPIPAGALSYTVLGRVDAASTPSVRPVPPPVETEQHVFCRLAGGDGTSLTEGDASHDEPVHRHTRWNEVDRARLGGGLLRALFPP